MPKYPMALITNKYIQNQIGLSKKAHGFSYKNIYTTTSSIWRWYYKFEYYSDSNDDELLPPWSDELTSVYMSEE